MASELGFEQIAENVLEQLHKISGLADRYFDIPKLPSSCFTKYEQAMEHYFKALTLTRKPLENLTSFAAHQAPLTLPKGVLSDADITAAESLLKRAWGNVKFSGIKNSRMYFKMLYTVSFLKTWYDSSKAVKKHELEDTKTKGDTSTLNIMKKMEYLVGVLKKLKKESMPKKDPSFSDSEDTFLLLTDSLWQRTNRQILQLDTALDNFNDKMLRQGIGHCYGNSLLFGLLLQENASNQRYQPIKALYASFSKSYGDTFFTQCMPRPDFAVCKEISINAESIWKAASEKLNTKSAFSMAMIKLYSKNPNKEGHVFSIASYRHIGALHYYLFDLSSDSGYESADKSFQAKEYTGKDAITSLKKDLKKLTATDDEYYKGFSCVTMDAFLPGVKKRLAALKAMPFVSYLESFDASKPVVLEKAAHEKKRMMRMY